MFFEASSTKLPTRGEYHALHSYGLLQLRPGQARANERYDDDEERLEAAEDRQAFLTSVWEEFLRAAPTLAAEKLQRAIDLGTFWRLATLRLLAPGARSRANHGVFQAGVPQLLVVEGVPFRPLDKELFGYTEMVHGCDPEVFFQIGEPEPSEFTAPIREFDLERDAFVGEHRIPANQAIEVNFKHLYDPEKHTEDFWGTAMMENDIFLGALGLGGEERCFEGPLTSPVAYIFQVESKPYKTVDVTPERRPWLIWPASAIQVCSLQHARIDFAQVGAWFE